MNHSILLLAHTIGVDSPYSACGDGSDCINRLTQVECLPDDCRCRAHCQNQRFVCFISSFLSAVYSLILAISFQLKQYAPIHIVLTEKKGFGLRAAADLPKCVFSGNLSSSNLTGCLHRDTFIYEYVGDVVAQPSMKKRMRDYAKEGIKHFYFMMLQKDEVSIIYIVHCVHYRTITTISLSTLRNEAVLADLQTIVAIPTVTSQNGPSDNMFAWESSPTEPFRRTKS